MIEIAAKFIECFIYQRSEHPRFLTLLRADGHLYPNTWQNVQGKIESGELAWQAGVREILEETGLTVSRLWNVDYVYRYFYPKTNQILIYPAFLAEVDHDDVTLSEEHTAAEWVSLPELRNRLLWRNQQNAIDQIETDFFHRRNTHKLAYLEIDFE